MSARGLVTGVAVVSALVLGLTGCQKKDEGGGTAAAPAQTTSSAPSTAPSAAPSAPGSAVASAPASAKASSTAGKSAPASATPTDTGEVVEGCSTPAPKPSWKYVKTVKPPRQDTLYVQDAKFVCDPNDGHYEGAGAEKTYMFATKVKAQIAGAGGSLKVVPVGELWQHIGDCLVDQAQVKDPYSCSGGIYEIVLDGSSKITEIREVWHP